MIIQPREWEQTGTSDRSAAGNGCFSWRKKELQITLHALALVEELSKETAVLIQYLLLCANK